MEYDSLGRPSKTVTSLGLNGADGDHYEKVTYDQYGRTFQVFDAARNDDSYSDNGVEHRYNAHGHLHQLVDAVRLNGATRAVYRQINAVDARGNVTAEVLGNNVTTGRVYQAQTGRLTSLISTSLTGSTGNVQDLTYNWDTLGNLTSRVEQSGNKNLSESFTYDGLNRLKTHTVAGQGTKTLTYNSLGNITFKTGVGSYSYGTSASNTPGPHAVTSAGGTSYSYDANGNNTGSSDGRSIAYTVFDQAASISKGGHTTTFAYGPERQRYQRTDSKNGNTRTTLYLGTVEKITHGDGTKAIKRHIGGIVIETEHYAANGTATGEERHYTLKDHLGSLDVITDASGQILSNGGEFSFDPWGQRRSGITWNDVNVAQLIADYGVFAATVPITTRGFTGHEMVDDVGIIHMNGRIYDPVLGRFLQADPFVQAPSDTQMLNRYSYTRNNPLNATDPSGYFSLRRWVGAIVAVVGTIICQGNVQCGAPGYALVGATSGAASAAANGGNILQGAIIGGISGAAFSGVAGADFSSFAYPEIARAAAFGVVGGVTNTLAGGKFGHGFFAAGFSSLAGPGLGKVVGKAVGPNAGRVIAGAVIGGTISKVTGGKFANGAAYGAFAAVVSSAARSATLAGGDGELPPEAYENLEERTKQANLAIDKAYEEGSLSSSRRFDTVDAAVKEVTGVAGPISDQYKLELGGDIQDLQGGFGYSRPVVGLPGEITIRSINPAALWHTHPQASWVTPLFSEKDISGLRSGIPMYKSYGGNLNVCTTGTCNYQGYLSAEQQGLYSKMRQIRTGRPVR